MKTVFTRSLPEPRLDRRTGEWATQFVPATRMSGYITLRDSRL